ncbi:uncharacterized protein LOC111330372 [Stylophora pistillata]|uniref:uncharacterized protein LOC111330372 n=1 Tax=Stylophora pistillata TaxID=50429 RepID=UPI000C04E697|nr:uncharacterized protein LOC111330372 [Stylophora pistillata]
MAVVGSLTKGTGEVVEFRHVLLSSEHSQGRKDDFESLLHSLKKLQRDVNSCLTEIIEQEKTSETHSALEKQITEDDDLDDSEDDLEDLNTTEKQNGALQEPQLKKLRT